MQCKRQKERHCTALWDGYAEGMEQEVTQSVWECKG